MKKKSQFRYAAVIAGPMGLAACGTAPTTPPQLVFDQVHAIDLNGKIYATHATDDKGWLQGKTDNYFAGPVLLNPSNAPAPTTTEVSVTVGGGKEFVPQHYTNVYNRISCTTQRVLVKGHYAVEPVSTEQVPVTLPAAPVVTLAGNLAPAQVTHVDGQIPIAAGAFYNVATPMSLPIAAALLRPAQEDTTNNNQSSGNQTTATATGGAGGAGGSAKATGGAGGSAVSTSQGGSAVSKSQGGNADSNSTSNAQSNSISKATATNTNTNDNYNENWNTNKNTLTNTSNPKPPQHGGGGGCGCDLSLN